MKKPRRIITKILSLLFVAASIVCMLMFPIFSVHYSVSYDNTQTDSVLANVSFMQLMKNKVATDEEMTAALTAYDEKSSEIDKLVNKDELTEEEGKLELAKSSEAGEYMSMYLQNTEATFVQSNEDGTTTNVNMIAQLNILGQYSTALLAIYAALVLLILIRLFVDVKIFRVFETLLLIVSLIATIAYFVVCMYPTAVSTGSTPTGSWRIEAYTIPEIAVAEMALGALFALIFGIISSKKTRAEKRTIEAK